VPLSPLRALFGVGVLAGAGCMPPNQDLPPVVLEGEHVVLRYGGSDTVCEGTAAYLDAVAAEFYSRLGSLPSSDARIEYVWSDPDSVGEYCSVGFACTKDDRASDTSIVIAKELPNLHEMVHATHLRVWPSSLDLLDEGLAEAWGSIQPDQRWPDGVAVADLFPSVDGGAEYVASHHIAHQTIEAGGLPAFEDLWRNSSPDSSLEEFQATYATAVGTTLDSVLATSTQAFACVRPACVGDRVSASEGGMFMLAPSPGCEDPATFGSDSPDSLLPLRRAYVLEGHSPGWFNVTLPSDIGDESVVIFRECDSVCHGDADEQVVRDGSSDKVQLSGIATEVIVWTEVASSSPVQIAPAE
jgi:hypothetical protein